MKRRTFLKAAGCSLVLPALESLGSAAAFEAGVKPKRLFILTNNYGVHLPHFYPEKTGKDFRFQDVAKSLEPLRNEVTLLGNLSHRPALHGHPRDYLILSGGKDWPSFGDSLDQFAAKKMPAETPFDCLAMSTNGGKGTSIRNKVLVRQMNDPEDIFERLFGKKDAAAGLQKLDRQRSILDLCQQEAKALSRQVSKSDKARLDEYFNSIRETEKYLDKNAEWIKKPAVKSGYSRDDFQMKRAAAANMRPEDFNQYYAMLLRFVELAFKFDLTRVAHVSLGPLGSGHHGASHHGNRPGSIAGLKRFDTALLDGYAGLLKEFKQTKMPEGGTLLDQTVSVWTASLGSASAHRGSDLPAIVAGGDFKHGSYTRFKEPENIANLYVTLLQKVGVETDRFINSTRTLDL